MKTHPCKLLLAFLLLLGAPTGLRAEPFPLYSEIRSNVEFWQEIYGRYYSSQGLLHDRLDLAVVYAVLEVENSWDNPARQRNRRLIDAAQEKYRAILLHLAAGGSPRNAEEQRVRELFGAAPAPDRLRRAAENIRFQRGLKDRFQEGVIRSGAYLEQIKEILRYYGVPEDLAYLPHVESSFNYEAYSRVGAAGIWQFMPATGRQYLTIDYVLDERRDPIRASHAAARLLRENHQRLGDWPLAITAYNHGASGMDRARSRHGSYPVIFREYDGPRFGFASRNFYPEFLAARQVAKNAERYFGPLQREAQRRSHEIELPGYLPLPELLRHLRLDLATLRRYNPGLREPVFAGEKYLPKGYRLRVPDSPTTVRLAGTLPVGIFAAEQKRSAFYTVQRGDTAGLIARRHRVGLSDLIAANQLDRRATIFAGQNLRIPGVEPGGGPGGGEEMIILAAAEEAPQMAPQMPPQMTPQMAPQMPLEMADQSTSGGAGGRPPAMLAGSLPAPERVAAPTVAAVAAPDNDLRPSEPALLGTRMALALSGDGSRLPAKVPFAGALAPEQLLAINPGVVSGHIRVEQVWREPDGRRLGTIRVEVEETLGHYADWLGVRAQELRQLNGFVFGRSIRLDQRLTIPLDRVDQAVFEELRYEFHKAMEEDFFTAFRVEVLQEYQVRRGDNIWLLSRDRFELPLWLIRKYNPGLELENLQPGQKIMVPQLAGRDRVTEES